MNRHSIEAKFVLLFLLMPFMLATAQTPKSPLAPTQIGVQTSAQGATHASTSYHSIYKLGGVYPEP